MFWLWIHFHCAAGLIILSGNNYISTNFQVKVVIVDSVTFHFRQDFEDLALRTRLLNGMALKLMNLSKTFNLAVSSSLFLYTLHNKGGNILPA